MKIVDNNKTLRCLKTFPLLVIVYSLTKNNLRAFFASDVAFAVTFIKMEF